MDPSNTCRFFLKGNCHYGERCRNYHPQTSSFGQGQGNVFARTQQNYGRGQQQQNYGGYNQQTQHHRRKIDENVLNAEEILKKDMIDWETGRIWPLSVYSPMAGKPNLPGFEDFSYEELRYATLQNNGQPPLDFQNKLATWNTNRMNYLRLPPENRPLLEAITSDKNLPSQQKGVSPFGSSQPQTSSIFGGGGGFGSTSVSSSFGGSSLSVSKPFGQAGFTSNTPNPIQPSFGAFGTTTRTDNSSMEMNSGGGGSSTLASFSFGQALSQTQSSSFNQGGFSNQGTNLMQPQPQQQQQSVFSSPFSFQSNLNQIPQQQPQQQFTSNITPSSGMFGQQQQPTQSTFPQMSPFGQPQLQQQQAFQQPLMNTSFGGGGGGGDSMQDDLTLYSKESDLSASEMQAFEANSFDINTLPLNAPPKRLCL